MGEFNNGANRIETLTEDSMSHTPRGGLHTGPPKRERYEWADVSPPGTFEWIHKTRLVIDKQYQRNAVSQEKVMRIARFFSWRLFGAVTIARRPDGTLTVVEGGHRVRAALKRDDVTVVPCMVFPMDAVREEAKAWVGINSLRSSMSSVDRHRGARVAEEPTAVLAAALLKRHGYNVEEDGRAEFTLKCISTVEGMVASDPERAERVIALATEIAGGEPLNAAVLRGLFTASRKWPAVFGAANQRKLIETGQGALMAVITRYKIRAGKGGNVVEADAIKEHINKGRRSRKIGVEAQ